MKQTKTITEWCKEVHTVAVDHGWWDDARPIPELLCLIHSEVSEALEAHRSDDIHNLEEELADVVIRVFDLCAALNIDLEKAVSHKNEINKKRPYRHGGKKC